MKTLILNILLHMGKMPHQHPHNGSYIELGAKIYMWFFIFLMVVAIAYSSPNKPNKS